MKSILFSVIKKNYSSMAITGGYLLILIIVTLSASPAAATALDHHYTHCTLPYKCGSADYAALGTVEYPFWGGENHPAFCGRPGFELKCIDGRYAVLDIGSQRFRVLGINQSRTSMRLARLDLYDDVCLVHFANTTAFNETNPTFRPRSSALNVSIFYRCPANVSVRAPTNNFTCNSPNGSVSTNFFTDRNFVSAFPLNLSRCGVRVEVLLMRASLERLYGGGLALQEALKEGFDVDYNVPDSAACAGCRTSSGVCGSNSTWPELACLCPDGPRPWVCQQSSRGKPSDSVLKAVVGITSGGVVFGILLIVVLLKCICGKRISYGKILKFWKKRSIDQQKIEAFMKNHGSLAQKKYSYAHVKRMTDSFRHKLGEGGYGSVFKGKLPNGVLVAVKVLSASKGNGEEFINEVASISRTSHVNVVTLVGFCFEGSKRALIYEFMHNGSLEKFIYNDITSKANQRLGWDKLNEIAVGIARGLEYLHRGCNTRILHFDIKPHNILLDEDFCPKISDFGLSKLCSRKESMVSMMEARGTIGYIAPEVFCRNFGGVSYKSDVYSYGMMVLEMVGGRRNLNADAEKTSEIYFPQWIYKRFELNEDLGLQGANTSEEIDIVKKMVIVGLWCIQTDPSLRPSMTKVIEMFEGKVEALQIPPNPFLSSSAGATPRFSSSIITASLE